jgi:hypothetical protein
MVWFVVNSARLYTSKNDKKKQSIEKTFESLVLVLPLYTQTKSWKGFSRIAFDLPEGIDVFLEDATSCCASSAKLVGSGSDPGKARALNTLYPILHINRARNKIKAAQNILKFNCCSNGMLLFFKNDLYHPKCSKVVLESISIKRYLICF